MPHLHDVMIGNMKGMASSLCIKKYGTGGEEEGEKDRESKSGKEGCLLFVYCVLIVFICEFVYIAILSEKWILENNDRKIRLKINHKITNIQFIAIAMRPLHHENRWDLLTIARMLKNVHVINQCDQ